MSKEILDYPESDFEKAFKSLVEEHQVIASFLCFSCNANDRSATTYLMTGADKSDAANLGMQVLRNPERIAAMVQDVFRKLSPDEAALMVSEFLGKNVAQA